MEFTQVNLGLILFLGNLNVSLSTALKRTGNYFRFIINDEDLPTGSDVVLASVCVMFLEAVFPFAGLLSPISDLTQIIRCCKSSIDVIHTNFLTYVNRIDIHAKMKVPVFRKVELYSSGGARFSKVPVTYRAR